MTTEIEDSFKSPAYRSPHSKEYWEGLKQRKIVFQRCKDCKAFTHPPGSQCTNCLSFNREYVPLSGRGTLYTYTVTRRPMHSEFKKDIPYVLCYVKLEEGPYIVSWLQGVDPDKVQIGTPVEATYEDIDERTTLHRFRPALAGNKTT